MTVDSLIDDFAVRSFRDVADADYIAARLACRAALTIQYLWASQQAVEKYLKCTLLLNRVPSKDVRHDLGKALGKIEKSGKVALDLTEKNEKVHRKARSVWTVPLFRDLACRIRDRSRES